MSQKSFPVSPLAPSFFPDLPLLEGVRFASAFAGIRKIEKPDVLLVSFDPGTQVAGVFTRSQCPSAAVDWCRRILPIGEARALFVNAGNANAFTGQKGIDSVRQTVQLLSKALNIAENTIFLASTGVIGEPLDAGKFVPIINPLVAGLSPHTMFSAAQAMMTTDTYPKIATATARLGEGEVQLNGMAKGSGMIAPDMATLLSFIFTDAPLTATVQRALLEACLPQTFNSITVDSDTSTSDTLLFFATGAARKRGIPLIEDPQDPRLEDLREKLEGLLRHLAHQVVKDGEGCTKFVEIRVEGAENEKAAKRIALSIANSPLVKTAIAGEDANWGRIVAAIGKAGEKAERDRLSIWFGSTRVAFEGRRDPTYQEESVSALMKEEEIKIRVHVGIGQGVWTVWTCDLTKTYVAINGDYRS